VSKKTPKELLDTIQCRLIGLDFDRKVGGVLSGAKLPWTTPALVDEFGQFLEDNKIIRDYAAFVIPSRGGIRAFFGLEGHLTPWQYKAAIFSLFKQVKTRSPLLLDESTNDYTRVMRVPLGIRNGVCVSEEFYAAPQFRRFNPTRRLPMSFLDLSGTASPNRFTRKGHVPKISQQAGPMPPPTSTPPLMPAAKDLAKGWNNYSISLVLRVSEQNPKLTHSELMDKIDFIARAMTENDTQGRNNWREIFWEMITRNHVVYVKDDTVAEEISYTPEMVSKRMAEATETLKKSKGMIQLSTPPGSRKSTLLRSSMAANPCGGLWLAPSRILRDASMRDFRREYPNIRVASRKSNAEILHEVRRTPLEGCDALGEQFGAGLDACLRALHKETALPRGYKNFMRMELETGKLVPRSFFEWLSLPCHPNLPILTEKMLAQCQKERRDNDSAIWRCPHIFATHESLMPIYADFSRRIGNVEARKAELALVEEELKTLRACGVEGLDSITRAERRRHRLISSEDHFLCGRELIIDEAGCEDFLNPDKVHNEAVFEVYGNRVAVEVYAAHKADEIRLRRDTLLSCPKVIFCSADRGLDTAAAYNGFPIDEIISARDIRISEPDLWVVLVSTSHGSAQEKIKALTEEQRKAFTKLYENNRNDYYEAIDTLVTDTSRVRLVEAIRRAHDNRAVICSGKLWRAARGGKIFELEDNTPLADYNAIEIVGSNDHMNRVLMSVACNPSPDQIAHTSALTGLSPDEAKDLIMVNSADQVVSRNGGCRGYDFFAAYILSTGEEPDEKNNLHIVFVDHNNLPQMTELTARPVHDYIDPQLEEAPPHAPPLVRRVVEEIRKFSSPTP
jgi:hypothetical protein